MCVNTYIYILHMAFSCHDTQSQMYSSCNESISKQGKKAISILLKKKKKFFNENEMKIFLYWLLLFTIGCICGGGDCASFFLFVSFFSVTSHSVAQ